MKSIIKHTLNSIRSNFGQTAIIVLTVVVVTAFFFVSFVMSDVFYTANTAAYNRYGEGMDFIVEGDAFSSSRIENYAKASSSVERFYFMHSQTGIFETDKVSKAIKIEGVDVDSFYKSFPNKFRQKEGVGNKKYEYPSVWVGEAFAEKCALSVGESVRIYLPSSEKYVTFSVTAVMYNEGVFGDTVNDNVIVDLSVLGLTGLVNTAYIGLKDGSDAEAERKKLTEYIADESITVKNAVDTEDVGRVVENNTRLLNVALIFVVSIMAVIMFTCYLIVARNRVNEMTVFKAAGATPGQIFAILLSEVLVYGVLGSIIGLIMGRVGLALVIKSLLPEFPNAISYAFWKYLAAFLLGIAVTVLSASAPFLRVAKKTIRELESGTVKEAKYVKPVYVLVTGILLFAGVLTVALWDKYVVWVTVAVLVVFALWLYGVVPYVVAFLSRFLRKAKGLAGLSSFSIRRNSSAGLLTTLVVAVIIFSFIVVSIIGVVLVGITTPAKRFKGDFVVTSLDTGSDYAGIVEEFKGQNGVKNAYAYRRQTYFMNVNGRQGEYDVIAVDRPEGLKYVTEGLSEESFKYFSEHNRVAIISYDMSKRYSLKIGDEFSVEREISGVTDARTESLGSYTVCGIEYTETADDKVVYLKLTEFFADNKPVEAESELYLVQADGTLFEDEVFRSLRKSAKGYDKLFVLTYDSWFEANAKGYSGISLLLSILRITVILVALIGVINLTVVTIYDRKREFDIYRISGMSRSMQQRLALYEGGLISLSGFLLGFLLCFITNRLMPSFAALIEKFLVFPLVTVELAVVSCAGALACFFVYASVAFLYKRKSFGSEIPRNF